jgi:hypothetical protein
MKYNNIIYVPNNTNLKNLILVELHKKHYLGHPGYQKTMKTMKKEYFWTRMKTDVVEYLARFLECQQVKVEHCHPTGLLQPIPILEWKWEVISMNFITRLPKTKKQNDSIMVVIDKITKYEHFILVKSTHKIINIADIFMKEIFRMHGIPKTIISNRDTKFTSNLWKVLFIFLDT